MSTATESNQTFRRLKSICVPLLGASSLTPSSISTVLNLLAGLHGALQALTSSGEPLPPSLVAYVFFPLSTLLTRNAPTAIPDQVLEKIFDNLAILIDVWWWDCELAIWEQLLLLCGAVVSGIENQERRRDEETRVAAAHCLLALLRERTPEEALRRSCLPSDASDRLHVLQQHARSPKIVPVLGQTLSALLDTAQSRNPNLQATSLRVLSAIISLYAPDNLVPSVLPGVISSMVKVALGIPSNSGLASGETVAGALQVILDVTIKAIGDEVCIMDGAIRPVMDLEDFATLGDIATPSQTGDNQPFMTIRTPSWLRGASSQLHIALNSLTPLVSHGNPLALLALIRTSSTILKETSQSLPQSTPLLLSFLLSLSGHDFATVSSRARESLLALLTTPSQARHRFLQVTMQMTRDNLSSLPRLIASQSDAKVEHAANLIEAICLIASTTSPTPHNSALGQISHSVGKLLGPSGGIERWGWTLLSVLDFAKPSVVEYNSTSRLLLESNQTLGIAFPYIPLKYVTSRSTYDALERMFHALSRAAGEECIFTIEWFANIGYNSKSSNSTAALWCACRLMEGLAEISLLSGKPYDPLRKPSQRLNKVSRMLAKKFSELWDPQVELQNSSDDKVDKDENTHVEFVQGLVPLHRTLKLIPESTVKQDPLIDQPHLHQAFCLQLIAVCAGILQARFAHLLLYTLYPILHSLTSPDSLVSSTAMASLDYLTASMSYASRTNLLLSNFDYALDGVSRRLTKRWLDIDATKVLVLLVRLVGSDVVDKAGDIVEECFTRLDEYHGYDVLVDGLIEVLGEVVKAIDTGTCHSPETAPRKTQPGGPNQNLDGLFEWIAHRNDQTYENDETDYGPAPRKAWGGADDTNQDETDDPPPQQIDEDMKELPSPAQTLTKQIVSHSLYFLTHASPVIRAHILDLLASSVPILPQAALLASIHQAWPFIINRLTDPHAFVVGAAAALIEALSTHVGTFMFQRVWNDVWPKFLKILETLDRAQGTNALSRRGLGAVGTESAYTHSHRLYRSLLKTMTAAMEGVDPQDSSIWQVILVFRRFLHKQAHEELQSCARGLYVAVGIHNADAVWLVLRSTSEILDPSMKFMHQVAWDIGDNVDLILGQLQ